MRSATGAFDWSRVDSQTGQNIIDLMREMNRKQGTTFIFSTHDAKVMAHASAVVKLADGRIVEKTTGAGNGAATAQAAAPAGAH